MKYLYVLLFSLTVWYTSAQNTDSLEVTIDDRPAKLNTKTGKFRFTDKVPVKAPVEKTKPVANTKVVKGNLHTVAKGDTFYSISTFYGISIAQLKSLNNITDNTLKLGQQLKIGYSQKALINDNKTCTVNKEDTLYSIAKRNNISVSELKSLNNLESDAIHIGQVLKLK